MLISRTTIHSSGGSATKAVTVRTRPEPKPFAGGRVFHVYPHGFKGSKMEPSFEGLLCAYGVPRLPPDVRVTSSGDDPSARAMEPLLRNLLV